MYLYWYQNKYKRNNCFAKSLIVYDANNHKNKGRGHRGNRRFPYALQAMQSSAFFGSIVNCCALCLPLRLK